MRCMWWTCGTVPEDGAFDQVLLMYNFMNLVTDTNIYKLNY